MIVTFSLILFILPTIINGKLCGPHGEGNLTVVSLSPYEKKITINIRIVIRMLNKRRKPTDRTLKAYDPSKLYNATGLYIGFKMGETVCTKDKKTPPCPIDDSRPKKFCTFTLHREIIKPENVTCQQLDCQEAKTALVPERKVETSSRVSAVKKETNGGTGILKSAYNWLAGK